MLDKKLQLNDSKFDIFLEKENQTKKNYSSFRTTAVDLLQLFYFHIDGIRRKKNPVCSLKKNYIFFWFSDSKIMTNFESVF